MGIYESSSVESPSCSGSSMTVLRFGICDFLLVVLATFLITVGSETRGGISALGLGSFFSSSSLSVSPFLPLASS